METINNPAPQEEISTSLVSETPQPIAKQISHLKSKILEGVGVSILFIVVAVIFLIPSVRNNFFGNSSTLSNVAILSGLSDIKPNPLSAKCGKNTIKEFGQINTAHDLLVYETKCIYQPPASYGYSRYYLFRYYVRDAAGTFNRLITAVDGNDRSYDCPVNVRIEDHDSNTIILNQCGKADVILDLNGKVVGTVKALPATSNEGEKLKSPDGSLTAISYFSDSKDNKFIDIENNHTQQRKTYTFPDPGINGIFPAQWSSDNQTVYIEGGVWEFGANAVLYSLNVVTGKITPYKNLDGFNFPIKIDPDSDSAFVTNGGDMMGGGGEGDTTPIDQSFYQFSLSIPQKPKAIITDHAVNAFNDLVKIDNNFFYQNTASVVTKTDLNGTENITDNMELKKFTLGNKASETLVTSNAMQIVSGAASLSEKWFPLFLNGKFVIYHSDGSQALIGVGPAKPWEDVSDDNTEYVGEIIGLFNAKK